MAVRHRWHRAWHPSDRPTRILDGARLAMNTHIVVNQFLQCGVGDTDAEEDLSLAGGACVKFEAQQFVRAFTKP